MADTNNKKPTPQLAPGFEAVPDLAPGFEEVQSLAPGFEEVPAPQAPTQTEAAPEGTVLDGLHRGFNRNIIPTAFRALGHVPLPGAPGHTLQDIAAATPLGAPLALAQWMGLIKDPEKIAAPSGVGGKVAEFAAGMADPAMWALGGEVANLYKLRSVSQAENFIRIAQNGRKLGALSETFSALGGSIPPKLPGLSRITVPSLTSKVAQYVTDYARQQAMRGLIDGGVGSFAQEALVQLEQEDFKPGDLLLRTGAGAAGGYLFGKLFGHVGASRTGKAALNEFANTPDQVTGLGTHLARRADELVSAAKFEEAKLAGMRAAPEGIPPETIKAQEEIVRELGEKIDARRAANSPIQRLKAPTRPGEVDLQAKITEHTDAVNQAIQNLRSAAEKASDERAAQLLGSADYIEQKKAQYIATRVIKDAQGAQRVKMPNGEWATVPIRQQKILTNKLFAGITNNTTLFSKVDAQIKDAYLTETLTRLGLAEAEQVSIQNRLYGAMEPVIQGLRQLNPTVADNFNSYLQHVHTDPGTGMVYWNAKAGLPAPDAQTLDLLAQGRKIFNAYAVELGVTPRQGYVPHYSIDPLIPKATQSFEKAMDKPFLHPQELPFNPNIHVNKVEDVVNRYVGEAAHYLAFKEHVPAVHHELLKLIARGYTQEAEMFAEAAARSMGLRERADLERMIGDSALEAMKPLAAVIRDARPEVHGEFWRFLQRQMYAAKVFLNPTTQVLQKLQPELVASAEVGPHNVTAARLGLVKEATNRAWERDRLKVLVPDPRKFLEGGSFGEGGFKNSFYRNADALSEWLTTIPRKMFSGNESVNREVAYKAAHHQFLKGMEASTETLTGPNAPLLQAMNAGQRKMILRTWNETLAKAGGPQAAGAIEKAIEKTASDYAMVRSLRANFMMTMADKPKFFARGFGAYIPFSTWPRNAWAQLVGDFEEGVTAGAIAQTARRAAIPAIAAFTLARLTGTEPFPLIMRAVPVMSAPQILSGAVAPQITSPVEELSRSGPAQAALSAASYTVPGSLLKQYLNIRDAEDNGNDPLRAFFGMRPGELTLQEQAERELGKLQRGLGFQD